jgi:hypothetical protein
VVSCRGAEESGERVWGGATTDRPFITGAPGDKGIDAPRRFRDALERARAEWAKADPALQARRAGCDKADDGVHVPYFGRLHVVTHPGGEASCGGEPVHAAVAILLLHYLLQADGEPQSGDWRAFRELPDGLFYSPSFATRAEEPIAAAFGGSDPTVADNGEAGGDGLEDFRTVAAAAGGEPLSLSDAAFAFQALPRVRVAVLLWRGDEDFPAEARIVFDGAAGHYLPAEDLAGLGEALTRRLTRR